MVSVCRGMAQLFRTTAELRMAIRQRLLIVLRAQRITSRHLFNVIMRVPLKPERFQGFYRLMHNAELVQQINHDWLPLWKIIIHKVVF